MVSVEEIESIGSSLTEVTWY